MSVAMQVEGAAKRRPRLSFNIGCELGFRGGL